MKELTIRKWHRNIGVVLALFIFLQAGSGVILTLKNISVPHSHANEKGINQATKEQEDENMVHEHGSANKETLPSENYEALEKKPNEIVEHVHDTQQMESHGNDGISPGDFIMSLHHGGGTYGAIYHLLIGIGMIIMALTGSAVFLKIQKRNSK